MNKDLIKQNQELKEQYNMLWEMINEGGSVLELLILKFGEDEVKEVFAEEYEHHKELQKEIEMEGYFREQLKTWCYNKVKRKFYAKYECYGFLQRVGPPRIGGDNEVFYYTYDLEEYKDINPHCTIFN